MEFEISEEIVIVSEPYENCPFVWVSGMTRHCGKTTKIMSKYFNERYNAYSYRIEADHGEYLWCGNCFEQITQEFDPADETDMKDLFGLI